MLSAVLHADRSHLWGNGETQLALVAHANRIAALLGPGRVVLSCRYARSYVPGLLGAWLAGATVELLPNVQPGTLDRVDADDELTYVLHDDAARQDRSPKAIYVPNVLSAPDVPLRETAWPQIAVRMTTSGTTERPKYVTKSMVQLLAELEVLASVIPTARCVLSTVPLSHLYGLLFGALLPLRFGARIVSHQALLPADIATIIERESVDLMISTPAHLRAMAATTMPRGLRVISSGARMPPELHAGLVAAHDWQVTDVLGSTEAGGIATRNHPMSAWTPLPGVTVSAPDGQLVVESPWCGAARAELDDRIEMRPGGTFQYLGRNAELVKIAGKRAAAHAIEATVLAVAGVADVALLVHAAAGKEPRIAMAISVAPGSAAGRDEVTAAIRQQFDAVFVPKIIKIVPRIPRSDRGKVDAETLRELLGLNAVATTHHIPIRRVAPGEWVAQIPTDLVFFRGHFDTFAILPGAVLVERVVWPIVKAELPELRALRGIKRLRFRRPVYPDQQLSVTVRRDPARVMFEVSCATLPVASGQLLVE